MRFFIPILTSLSLFAATSASAGSLVYPKNGKPAIGFTVPDDWAISEAAGKITATAPDRSASFTATFIRYKKSLDELAIETNLAANAISTGGPFDVMFSSYMGYVYYATKQADPNTGFRVIAIQLDDDLVALCTLTINLKANVGQTYLPERIVQSISLTAPE